MADMLMMMMNYRIVSCQLVLYNGFFRDASIEVGKISLLGFRIATQNTHVCEQVLDMLLRFRRLLSAS